jgi:secreted trypsin-like serine protease
MKFALALFLIVLSEATLAFEVDWSKVVSLRPQRQPNKQSGISGRIVGGKEATPNSFPFQAALFAHVPGDEENQGLCGGSIISPVTILTAAHCFNHNGMYSSWTIVIVGAHNIDNSEASQVRMNATNIKVHKDYNNKTMQNE